MSTYTIGEVAERSGFPATALRYYEGIGLVAPTGRSAAGYRLYDDRVLTRLAFIARAKQLGCTLDEIADLVGVWGGDRCGPMQRRLHELVSGKLRDADRQVVELTAFTGQLRTAATQLAGEPVDGPCDDTCACLHEPPAIACTLGAGEIAGRLDAWCDVLGHVTGRLALPSGGQRVEFGDVDIGALARLVQAEQACCSFFRLAITVDERGVALEVDAPEDAGALVEALFGTPS